MHRRWGCLPARRGAVSFVAALTILGIAGCSEQGRTEPSSAAGAAPPVTVAAVAPTAQSATGQPAKPPAQAAPLPPSTPPAPKLPEPGKPMNEADQQQLIEMIKAQVEALQRDQAVAATTQPAAPVAAAAPATPPAPAGGATATAPAGHKPGCGDAVTPGLNLNPPPPDQPQPKFAARSLTATNDQIWVGKTSTFAFNLRNEGAAPLAIHLKPG